MTDPIPPTPPADPAPAPPALPKRVSAHKDCANCGAPMHGPFCYACGQPEKGMIRHLASVMADVADTVFNVDSRIFRSIPSLFFRPGYLTNEYFSGRRTRYVTPFRLFFFLCILSFFAIQFSLNLSDGKFQLIGAGNTGGVENSATPAEVEQRTKAALEGLEKARRMTGAAAGAELDAAAAQVRSKADQRLVYLKAKQAAEANGTKPPPDPQAGDEEMFSFDGKPWDPTTHPLAIAWLPAFVNAKLNEMTVHAKDNLIASRKNPGQAFARLFSVLPQTLFVLMPLFAVLLKVFYVFKRRLYMEHLMVALHSHAFIFMSLLLIALVHLLMGWASTGAPWSVPVLGLLRDALWIWLPVYLFLMQKKVYRQGWIMTTLKYTVIGICYVVLLSFGLAAAAIVSLTLT